MVLKLKRIGVMKMAFFMGLYGVLLGFIIGFLLSIFISMIYSFSNLTGTLESSGFFLQLRWLNLIFWPVFFGIFNFLIALVLTPLMNLILKIIKGLELDIVEEEDKPFGKQVVQRKPKVSSIPQVKIKKIESKLPNI